MCLYSLPVAEVVGLKSYKLSMCNSDRFFWGGFISECLNEKCFPSQESTDKLDYKKTQVKVLCSDCVIETEFLVLKMC